jgi:xanthine dehydrogenase accessory factor
MNCILIRGGGDLASGVALRLCRAGFRVIIAELPNPLAVRRLVSFSEAVYAGEITIEGLTGRRSETPAEAFDLAGQGFVPVLVDPELTILKHGHFPALIDARLLKRTSDTDIRSAPLVIGLGPGFIVGENCHAVVETMRGHTMGRVYWTGSARPDTGVPDGNPQRVLRAPSDGVLKEYFQIADHVDTGQLIAEINGEKVTAPLSGVLRGLIRPGVSVPKGMKIGDIDQSDRPEYCSLVSDKAMAVAGGVLEAIMSKREIRLELCSEENRK